MRACAAAQRRGAHASRRRIRLMQVLVLSHDDVTAALDPDACRDAMARVLAAHTRGETYMPLRSMLMPPGAEGFMGLMPAWRGGAGATFALKAICVMPG